MKVYVNWEWEKIVKTEVEAEDYLIKNRRCYTFAEFLARRLDSSIEEVFYLCKDEQDRICDAYARYLDEVVKDCWEIVEIQRKGAKTLFCAF